MKKIDLPLPEPGSLLRFASTCVLVVAICVGVRFAVVETRTPPPDAVEPASRAQPAEPPPPAAATPSEPARGVPLTQAPILWSRPAIDELLASGGDVNVRRGADGKTPLLYAARGSALDRIVPLLEAGADPRARDFLGSDAVTELLRLGVPGSLGSARQILSRIRPAPDLRAIDAIAEGDPERIARWLASGPDLEARGDLERTPLLWAVYYDRQEIALDLLRRGARLDVRDYRENTPLHFAAMNGNRELARRLLAAGAKLDAVNDYGETPLALSLFAPDTQMMRYLLDRGADPCLGPRGRSDTLDLARTTLAGNEAAAVALLEPAVGRRACGGTPEEARRANAREFTARLRALTPPPPWVLDESLPVAAVGRGDALIAATQGYYERSLAATSLEELESLTRTRRAIGYRAVLDHPDDESFAWTGAGIWSPDRRREDAQTELRIEALRTRHFFYYQVDEECPICDPGEHTKGNRPAIAAHFYAKALLREGRLLEAVDVLEKFERERIHETTRFFRSGIYEELMRLLWLLGRKEEARRLGEAAVVKMYGAYPSKGGRSRLETILGHLRSETEASEASKSAASESAS